MFKLIAKVKFELAIALMFCSIPLAQSLRMLLGTQTDYSSIFLILAILLLFDYNNLFNLRLPTMRLGYIGILLFQLYNFFLAEINHIELFQASYGTVYILFLIVLLFAFSSTKKDIKNSNLINVFAAFYFIINMLIFIALIKHTGNSSNIYVNSIEVNGSLIADRLTLSTTAYGYMIILLVFKPLTCYGRIFKYFAAIPAVYVIFATTRRGLFVCLAVIVIIHIVKRRKLFIKPVKIISFLILILILFLVINLIPEISLNINRLTDSTWNAVLTLFNGSANFDPAALTRAQNRSTAINEILNKFDLWQLLFGKGYMSTWLDFPFLQAFYDMGISGGVTYFIIQSYAPLKLFFRSGLSENENLIFYFSVIGFSLNLFSGIPYGFYKYVYLLPAYYILFHRKHEKGKGRDENIICRSYPNRTS